MTWISSVICHSNISKKFNKLALITNAKCKRYNFFLFVNLCEWFGSIRKLTKACKDGLCSINLDGRPLHHSLSHNLKRKRERERERDTKMAHSTVAICILQHSKREVSYLGGSFHLSPLSEQLMLFSCQKVAML